MICPERQCIFVHIPKTAGNSINRVFGVEWQDHKDLQRYADELDPDIFERFFKFAVVRNPWERLLSDYNYQIKKSRERRSKLHVFSEDGAVRDFPTWVETVLTAPFSYAPAEWGGDVSPHIHRWSPQVDWISVGGAVRVDFICRLENLEIDFDQVCDRLGLPPLRVPHRNGRLHLHYSRYFDATTREVVRDYYRRDIEKFGYEFERPAGLRVWISRASEPPPAEEAVLETELAPSSRRWWWCPAAAAAMVAILLVAVSSVPSTSDDAESADTVVASRGGLQPFVAMVGMGRPMWMRHFWGRHPRHGMTADSGERLNPNIP